jgi:hypothetical protein
MKVSVDHNRTDFLSIAVPVLDRVDSADLEVRVVLGIMPKLGLYFDYAVAGPSGDGSSVGLNPCSRCRGHLDRDTLAEVRSAAASAAHQDPIILFEPTALLTASPNHN